MNKNSVSSKPGLTSGDAIAIIGVWLIGSVMTCLIAYAVWNPMGLSELWTNSESEPSSSIVWGLLLLFGVIVAPMIAAYRLTVHIVDSGSN